MEKTRYIIIYTTFPDIKTAKTIITGLVDNKFAACGNIFKLYSIYQWHGSLENESEYGAFIKTTKKLYAQVEKYIQQYHPYDVPEIVSWPIERGSAQYLAWIDGVTANRKQ